MSKGSARRPTQISRQEEDLRYALAFGKITFKVFEQKMKALHREGLIHRSGRCLKS